MPKLRLDKLLANLGFGSRSDIKKELKKNCLKVNGEFVKDGSVIIDTDKDKVLLHGEEISYVKYIYLMMNKPKGVISATEDRGGESTVTDLLDSYYKNFTPFPVGRLDKDTEGLLILTNDGKLAHNMLSPKKHVDKTYFTRITGELDESHIKNFDRGVTFLDDGYVTMPAKLEILTTGDESQCLVTIREGKFHQIKRMFESINKKVIYLKRISMGSIQLDENLELGKYRELNEREMMLIKKYLD